MLAVDMFRLLNPVSEHLDISKDETESPLLAELETANTRIDIIKTKCSKKPGNLRAYRNELGTPQETRLLKKDDLNKNGLAVPTGDGETIIVSYDIPDQNHDIVVPEDWDIPPVRSNENGADYEGLCLEDLPEKTRKRLMNQAREEIIEYLTEFLDEQN